MQKRRHFARPGAPNSSSPTTNASTTPATTTSPPPTSVGSPESSSSFSQKSPNTENHDTSSLPIASSSMDQSDDYINFDATWFSKWNNEGNILAEKYVVGTLTNGALDLSAKHSAISQFFFIGVNQKEHKLSEDNLCDFITKIASNNPTQKTTLLFALIFALEMQSQRLDQSDSNYTYLTNIVKTLRGKDVISNGILKQTLNFSFLSDCGVDLDKRLYVKSRTRELYTQDRFNLLHEENEGFSKIISLIFDSESMQIQKVDSITKQITQMIGFFNLEPNRVLDIILDAYENFCDNDTYPVIISSLFNQQHLRHVVGFKLLGYQNEKSTPSSLFILIVNLMKKNMLTFEDIISYLGPHSMEELIYKHMDFDSEKKQEAKSYAAVSLDGSTTDKLEPRFDKTFPEFQKDQKFGFVTALLNYDLVDYAIKLLDILSKFDPHWSYDISMACCNSIEKLISPIYSSISQNKKDLTSQEVEIMEKQVLPLVFHAKYELYRNLKTLTKLIRILKVYIRQDRSQDVLRATFSSLLSSLCFVGYNTVLVSEFWDLFSTLPINFRYEVYGLLRKFGYERQPKLMAQQYFVSKNVRLFFNRISVTNINTKAKEILQYAVSNPLVVCEEFLRKCENYDVQISLSCEASKYIPGLFHDMMGFCILEKLVPNERSRIKDDGISIATWLSNLATFYGLFFKHYPHIDTKPVFNYLIQRIKEGVWEDLIVLSEIIKKASDMEYSEEINQTQLEAQAGGRVLSAEAGGLSPSLAARSKIIQSITVLRDTMLKTGKGRALLLLAAKLSNFGVFLHDDQQDWRHVCESKDTCHVAYLLLLKFLANETKFIFDDDIVNNKDSLILPIPGIETLQSYSLSPSFIFSIARPTCDGIVNSIPTKEIEVLLPADAWSHFTPQFYKFFWMTDLPDIYVPKDVYNSEIEKTQKLMSSEEVSKSKQRKQELEHVLTSLQKELKLQTQKQEATLKQIKEHCNSFMSCKTDFVEMNSLLQYCILPRTLFSAADSLFCAKFVHTLHTVETPKFSLNLLLQTTLRLVPGILMACTEFEVRRLSRFIQNLLIISNRWRDRIDDFKKECKNTSSAFVSTLPQISSTSDDYLKLDTHTDFHKFHYLISNELVETCLTLLDSGDNLKVRLVLLFLTPIANARAFPSYKNHCTSLADLTEKLKESPFENIKVLANAYHPLVKDISKNLRSDPMWIPSLHTEPTTPVVEAASSDVIMAEASPSTSTPITNASDEVATPQEISEKQFSPVSVTSPIEEQAESIRSVTPPTAEVVVEQVNEMQDDTKVAESIATEQTPVPVTEPKSEELLPQPLLTIETLTTIIEQSGTSQKALIPESPTTSMNTKLQERMNMLKQGGSGAETDSSKPSSTDSKYSREPRDLQSSRRIGSSSRSSYSDRDSQDQDDRRSSDRRLSDNRNKPNQGSRRTSDMGPNSPNKDSASSQQGRSDRGDRNRNDRGDRYDRNDRGDNRGSRNDTRGDRSDKRDDTQRSDFNKNENRGDNKRDDKREERRNDNRSDNKRDDRKDQRSDFNRNDNRNDKRDDRDSGSSSQQGGRNDRSDRYDDRRRNDDRHDRRSDKNDNRSDNRKDNRNDRDDRNDFRSDNRKDQRSDNKGDTSRNDRRNDNRNNDDKRSDQRDNRNDDRNDRNDDKRSNQRNDNRNDDRRGSDSSSLKRQYSERDNNQSSSSDRHESDTKKKRFNREPKGQ